MISRRAKRRVLFSLVVGAVLIATIPLAWMQPKTLLRALPVELPTPPELIPPNFDFSQSAVQTELKGVSQTLAQQGESALFVGVWDIALGCYGAEKAKQVLALLQRYDYRAYLLPADQYISRHQGSSVVNQCEQGPEPATLAQRVGVSIGPYLRNSKAALDLEGLEALKFDVISKAEVVEYWPWN